MGSEMCIRDRPLVLLPLLALLAHHSAGPGGAAPAGRGPARAGRCLLYTSDAADERSSVDLGGRRIIKKKKHQTHQGAVHNLYTI